VGRRLADLSGGDDEHLVLDRACSDQHLPVIPAGALRERGGDGDQAGPAEGEAPVQLWEPEVVADAQTDQDAARIADRDLVPGLLNRRLAVRHVPDVHVEHVDLAIDRAGQAIRSEHHRGVRKLLPSRNSLGDASGDQVNPEFARPTCGGGEGRPIEWLGRGGERLRRPESRPLLGQDDEFSSVGGRGAHQPLRDLEVAVVLVRGVELYGCDSHVSRRLPCLPWAGAGFG
jgi:hypothetical protein